MKKNFLKKIGISVGLGLMILPLAALAQQPIVTSLTDISDIIAIIFTWVSGIIFTISIIMLLYSAILFLTAGASETTHKQAKNVLIYAIVGITVAILAYSIRPFLENLFRGQL